MTTTAPAPLDISVLLPDGTHLVAGEWVSARSKATLDVVNPATGAVIARVPRGTAKDIDDAVRAAEDALPAWRDTSPASRSELLYRWAELVREHDDAINRLEAIEVGHPVGPSPIAARLTYLAGKADKVFGDTLPTRSPDVLGLTLREPYGVVGAIIPWNAPGPMTVFNTAAPIAAGNTVVLKPAEDAPLTALYLAHLAQEAGIPPGVLNVVTGYGTEAGAALPDHPGIRKVSFTGSPATGTAVMEACARNLIPLQLELGGKSPQLVLPDADLAKAVPAIVRSIVMNSGQVCAAGSRVLVHSSLHDRLVSEVADAFRAVRVGLWDQQVDMGPLINARQEKRVLDYLAIGKAEGAEVVVGGGKLTGEPYDDGYFVEPTLFDRVTPGMRIAQEEIFGPVLSVLTYDDEDEAVAIANGTRYGLTATLWTQDVGRAVRLARRVQAGQVAVNTLGDGGPAGAIGAPFGGYKHSGFGRSMGPDYLEDWTQVKCVVINAG
ncbi:aldehyde dehydrogenase family protein [Streptomyces sp. CA-210063]|uniref:aldehyde dehydrogenase family protein n=1 Tax=Streptomyces sp. CA-210063 TaxID=2801029 RepID=UPI00214C0C2D|nr:aldehyde dehydrogenase family protein [Streptomyces sp. CA-210063]UUU29434.1 aldehyde dehydrogenase family protein [Streptomyces sp. CA-210063]